MRAPKWLVPSFLAGQLTKHQKLVERLMASTVVLYSFAATFVVWRELRQFGVNPILFFVIDVATSWPYGIATTRIVVNFINKEWRAVQKWSWIASACFVTPQIYVLLTASSAPPKIYHIVEIVIAVMVVFAITSVVLQIRSSKKK